MGPKTNSGASKKVEQKKKERIIEVSFERKISINYDARCDRSLSTVDDINLFV